MAHIEDRWYRTIRSADGSAKRERTARHGTGLRWRARYLDPDGRERSKSFDRRVDAERFKTQAEADILRGTYLDPDAGKMTLRRYAADWLRGWHADSGHAEKLRSHLENHILPGLGSRTLAQLAARPSAVSQWLSGLPVSARTAGQVLGTLSSILSAAADDGLIARNPCKTDSVRPPKVPRRKVVPWTAGEVSSMRSELPEPCRAMADCGAGLGLRQGEIFALGPDVVDFLRRRVNMRRQVKIVVGRAWFGLPKGDKEREVPLPGTVALALSAHLAAYPAVEVTLPWYEPSNPKRHGKPVTFPLMFPGREGRVRNASAFNTVIWRPARARAGIAHSGREDGMHALRHYYASVLLAGGVDIRALSEYLGHHDPAFTLRTYAHLMPSAEGKALRAVESALSVKPDGPDTSQDGVNGL